VAWYFAGDLSNDVQITLASATLGTWASGGFVAVDNTNMPGWYEIGIPNAALDGGNECSIQLRGAANMVPVNIYIELDTVDYQTAAFGAVTPLVAGRQIALTETTGKVNAELDSATQTQVTNIENASGYLLAVLAGECADPQTASETYAITVFGSTFTVDMAGQTSTGTRTAPTLTKT
jgi:hypothetical protein